MPRRLPARLLALALPVFFFLFSPGLARADAMYCADDRLVRTGQSTADVTAACGAPTRREDRTELVCLPNDRRHRCFDRPVDAWVYEAEDRVPRMLIFYGGLLIKIAVYYPH